MNNSGSETYRHYSKSDEASEAGLSSAPAAYVSIRQHTSAYVTHQLIRVRRPERPAFLVRPPATRPLGPK
jgi:hypothetical protein